MTNNEGRVFEQGEGAAPATQDDHPHDPRGEWWTVCRVCGLAMAAHTTTTVWDDYLEERRRT